jgi:hypothetical protein
MSGVADKRPPGAVWFTEEVGQIGRAVESLLLFPAANPLFECGYPCQNIHDTGLDVPSDSGELRDFPGDEDGRQSIVRRKHENRIAVAQVQFEAVYTGAVPI